jgi:hypothetical protein
MVEKTLFGLQSIVSHGSKILNSTQPFKNKKTIFQVQLYFCRGEAVPTISYALTKIETRDTR